MKNLFSLAFVMVMCCLTSCNKNNFEPDYSQGKATANKNGETWIGQGRGVENNQGNGFDFYFDVYDDFGQHRQQLSFIKIPKNLGVFQLFNTFGQSLDSISGCNFLTSSHDGDVVEDRYRVDETGTESTVTVIDYNNSTRLLSGKFRVKLYIDPNRPKANPSNPDTLLFENGQFEVKIEE